MAVERPYAGAGHVAIRLKGPLIHNGVVLATAGEKIHCNSMEAERMVREGKAEYPRN